MKLLLFIFITNLIFAQDQQSKINDQVWKPFINAFSDFNTDSFLTVHSKDLIRSARDSWSILDWQGYFDQQKEGDQRSRASGTKRQIELRFTERISSDNQAIDVGIYKTTYINSSGEARSFFGRFHVVLRKENDVWKILVDTDSTEGNTITEEVFNKAKPLE